MLMLENEPSFVGECSSTLKATKIVNKRSGDIECYTCGENSKNKSLYKVEQTINVYMYYSLGIFCEDCMLKTFKLKKIDKEEDDIRSQKSHTCKNCKFNLPDATTIEPCFKCNADYKSWEPLEGN